MAKGGKRVGAGRKKGSLSTKTIELRDQVEKVLKEHGGSPTIARARLASRVLERIAAVEADLLLLEDADPESMSLKERLAATGHLKEEWRNLVHRADEILKGVADHTDPKVAREILADIKSTIINERPKSLTEQILGEMYGQVANGTGKDQSPN